MSKNTLLMLPGDGIGPEVTREVRRIIDWLAKRRHLELDIAVELVGGCAIDKHGVPLTDETMAKALEVDAVLLGAVGGPKWDSLPFAIKPERGLLRLRKEMGLFANLRPALCYDSLVDASTLKPEIVRGQGAEPPHGLRQGQGVLIASVLAQHPNEIPIGARVGRGFQEDALGRLG